MTTISVIVGSTRHGRFSEKPAHWILQHLQERDGIEARLLDLRDFPMPFFDQPMPPAMPGRAPYEHEVVKRWTAAIAAIGQFCFRHPGIQLRHLSSAQKCDRLGLSGVEPQGGCFRKLRQRHGRARHPAAPGNHDRGSDRPGALVRPHTCHDSLGAFPGR